MKSWLVYFAVIVSGASVLAIEMLGTRILGPFYGVSLYLWSALISVTLAALSLGYSIGGRWADRGPTLGRFATILGAAGLWICLIPWLRSPILAAAEPLGLRTAVLIAAALLFFPPLALLGMVSPYAIRLKATRLETVGTTAGNLFAVSTIASVLSAVATGFLLIPNVGVYSLVTIIGVSLLVTAAIVSLASRERKVVLSATLLVVALGAVLIPGDSDPAARPEEGLVDVRQSLYGEIRVVDYHDTRHLLIDGGTHTIVDRASGESHFAYVHVIDLAREYFASPGDVLLVGLGGGSVAKNFARAGWDVDAVEIDPVITEMAHTYFGLGADQATVFDMDARQYLLTHDKTYDLIVMDAFGSSSIPFHLVTTEAFALLRSRLKPNGVLVMNVESLGWDDPLVGSLLVTARTQFPHAMALPIAEPPDQLGNAVLFISDRSLELSQEPPVPTDRFSAEYDRKHAWDNRFESRAPGALVLTDELNPVDVWAERINQAARKQLRQYFGDYSQIW